MKSLHDRLMRKISINAARGCWDWVGSKDMDGYGRIRIEKKLRGAHRVSFAIHIGPIPDDMCVCHTCDNPGCINPEHLFLGTNADNTYDRNAKGRTARQTGASNGQSKITDDDVIAIRAVKARWGVNTRLAAQYGVSQPLISQIRAGKRWSHLA